MNCEIHSRRVPVDHQLRSHAQSRLSAALNRFASRIRRVRLRLDDQNGPKGGRDIRYRVEVMLHPRGVVRLESDELDVERAIAAASSRIAGAVARNFERHRRRRRAG